MKFSVITKTVLGAFFCYLIIHSCNDSFFPNPRGSFFSGSIDGENRKGSGVVFLDEQGQVELIKIIVGNEEFLQEINISLEGSSSGTYEIIKDQASVAEIYGLDAVGYIGNSTGNSSDFVTILYLEGSVEGEFSFEMSDFPPGSNNSSAKGQFRFEASSSGNWNCNFGKRPVMSCYFLE